MATHISTVHPRAECITPGPTRHKFRINISTISADSGGTTNSARCPWLIDKFGSEMYTISPKLLKDHIKPMLETILKYFSTTNSARHFQHDNLSTIQFQTAVPRAEIACYTWSMRSSTRTISARGQSQTATPA